jgi:hypothetical protein
MPDGSQWTKFYRLENGYLLRFPKLADFQVSVNGRHVVCQPAPETSGNTINHLYNNQVLPLALSITGQLVFHGSAVAIENTSIAFVGETGRGKSTLAATFATTGYCFLTDDGLLIEEDNNRHFIRPSHPSIRLWQDSEAALLPGHHGAEPPLEFTTKSRFLADNRIQFCSEKKALNRVYFLGDGSAPSLQFQRMKGVEVMAELVKHSFLLDIELKSLLTTHFNEVSRLANLPVYYRLDFPRNFEELPRVRDAIVAHVEESS